MITDFEADGIVFMSTNFDDVLPPDESLLAIAHNLWAANQNVELDSFHAIGPISRTKIYDDGQGNSGAILDKIVKIVPVDDTDKLLKGFVSGT